MNEYKEILIQVGNTLKLIGWKKKGDTFCINKDNNWGLIAFQKSKSSSIERVIFTINLGVSSREIRKFNEQDLLKIPDIEDCHWRKRIGFYLPQKQDHWWQIDHKTVLKNLIGEITDVIDKIAIPEISKRIKDTDLENLWLSGVSDGLTDLQRLICLTILLKAQDSPNLTNVIIELKNCSKGKSYEFIAKSHIKQLGFSYE